MLQKCKQVKKKLINEINCLSPVYKLFNISRLNIYSFILESREQEKEGFGETTNQKRKSARSTLFCRQNPFLFLYHFAADLSLSL
jgi:hypothetical protein